MRGERSRGASSRAGHESAAEAGRVLEGRALKGSVLERRGLDGSAGVAPRAPAVASSAVATSVRTQLSSDPGSDRSSGSRLRSSRPEERETERRIPTARPAAGRCNGLPLRGAYANIGTLFGTRTQELVLERLPHELSEGLSYGVIVTGGWYPISWLSALHQAAQDATGSGRELARKLGYLGSKSYFRGVHRVFIAFMDPGFVIGKSPTVFRKYYDTGTVEVTDRASGHCVLHWSGCTGFDSNLWQAVFGACEAVLELSGAKNIRLRQTRGALDYHDYAELNAYWT